MEEPYVPFYKPYGMTDEEYDYEVRIAEQRHAEWEAEMEANKISVNLPVICPLPQSDELDYMWQCHCCGEINYTKKCSCGNGI